jgi:protein required for attachment to host cells
MKPISYLYLIAGDQDFRLVHTHGTGLAEISNRNADAFPNVEHNARGGQSLSHAGGPGHGFEVAGHSTKDEIERGRFAKHIAAALVAEWAKGSYDRIVITAGPKMLGEIRHELPKSLHDHIAAEMHKDLVKVPLHDLPSHFAGAIPAV